jgi:hypothetical protein
MSESNDHIKPLRLFDIARESGPEITDHERQHIRACAQCEQIIEVFARQFEKPFRARPGKAGDGDAA